MKTLQKKTTEPNTDFGAYLQKLVNLDPELQAMVDEEETNLSIAEEIYRLRTENGLTQQQLARKIDTTQSVIARIEDADYDGHSLKTLQRVARALGVRFRAGFYAVRVATDSLVMTQEVQDTFEWPEVVPTVVD